MNASSSTPPSIPSACPACLRRARLLAQLAPYIERQAVHSSTDLFHLLALSSEELVGKLAPRESERLLAGVEAIPEAELRASVETAGCWASCHHDPLFPAALLAVPGAPVVLFGRGEAALLSELSPQQGTVAIVGARRASSYGREVARQLGRDLAEAGHTVISGMAFGIDACAHRGALEAGHTVAVLGCGPDVAYPASHRSLWRRIQEQGLVISELSPGTGAWRWSFPARNRIVAALAAITVVVEAAEGSGTMTTVRAAQQLDREIGAVPGPVNSRTSAGANVLLAAGARVIRDAQDVRAALRPLRADAPEVTRRV